MRVLLDQGVPAPLRRILVEHEVVTAYERGWSTLTDGELLAAAEHDGFEVFVTTDTNLKFQQTLSGRAMAIIVLGTTSWPRIRNSSEVVVAAIAAAESGCYAEIKIA
ncbi:MAG: hypothetical protein KFB96_14365 [Thiocapsa sp.]|uniref:DUF5615 family PIN-like protein n=1 Tax=Thiocapsa sp. TaxID=2024551 RepID=UPI001BCB5C41|nr:DUF5615 family PIN-like protein [Thiocapsa sp.]QVL46928.1 MAG: hypothetical protein KFB96_14365 [Thiocapsa sp.]